MFFHAAVCFNVSCSAVFIRFFGLLHRPTMADKPNIHSSHLPKLNSLNGSLPKLTKLGQRPSAVIVPALSSAAAQRPADKSDFDDEDAGATSAIPQPSAADIAAGLEQLRLSTLATEDGAALSSSADQNVKAPPLPSLYSPASAPNAPSQPIMPPSSPESAPVPESPAVAESNAPAKDANPSTPEFGNAAAEHNDDDDELKYEDEGPDELGEKTVMLSEIEDDLDGLDEENQKTQISMEAMDYDPLSGKLIVESGKSTQREYVLVREKTSIGRIAKNDIAISDPAMSREHAQIDKFKEGFRIRDLDSGNGTFLNGYRIRVGQLRNGDIIEIGGLRFRFEQFGGDPEDLWKGAPKIEFHPNQKVVKSGARQPANNVQEQPQTSAPLPPAPAPQMDTMLERQGGGLAAAQWNNATSPYLMGYGANLRPVYTTPLWAIVVLAVLGILCLLSIGFCAYLKVSNTQAEAAAKAEQTNRENIADAIKTATAYYDQKNFKDAREQIKSAEEIPSSISADLKPIFTAYKTALSVLEHQNDDVKKIRNLSSGAPIEEYEKAYQTLNEIPEENLDLLVGGKTELEKLRNSLNIIYADGLKTEIRKTNDISKARHLVAKLGTLPKMEQEFQIQSKILDDREKAQRE